jgi:hypothetical protein
VRGHGVVDKQVALRHVPAEVTLRHAGQASMRSSRNGAALGAHIV